MVDMTVFSGPWIGETMGHDSPAHIWEIEMRKSSVLIHSRWEGESGGERMTGRFVPGEQAFNVGDCKAVLIDPQHFVIAGWDTNDTRGGQGPAFDVVFSRPGISELSVHEAYKLFLSGGNHGLH